MLNYDFVFGHIFSSELSVECIRDVYSCDIVRKSDQYLNYFG